MLVQVDRDTCIGAGNCVLTAPEVFDQDDGGVVELLDAHPPAEYRATVRDAVARCPSGAISLLG